MSSTTSDLVVETKKRKQPTTTDASSASPVPQMSTTSINSSQSIPTTTDGTTQPSTSYSTELDAERALKRAKREERKAAVAALDEAVDPIYPGYPECRVLIYNVAKKQNVGTIVRTAVAFAATQMIVVGNRQNLLTFGNQATNRFISWKQFEKWPDALKWIRANGWKLIGVEIGERAKNVSTRPFSDKTIFILGNEGQGLSPEVMDACDELVYIPQYGRGTASLNVATAASIVLHHFAEWAKYPSHTSITGYKFDVDESKVRTDPGLKFKQLQNEGTAAAASSTSTTTAVADTANGDGGEDCEV